MKLPMNSKYSLVPTAVPKIKTKYRRIQTKLPVPASLPIFRALMAAEPESMRGQPPVMWDKAKGFQVSDRWGNTWLDWSSAVLVANIGHGRKEVAQAIKRVLDTGVLTTYAFVHEDRMKLCKELQRLSPEPSSYQVALYSGGSEAVECALKLAKTYGIQKHGTKKNCIISFNNAFHGRTLGAQLAGGKEELKKWTVGEGRTFVQVPFPDGYKNTNVSFDLFLKSLRSQRVRPEQIAGVIVESYQGGGPDFMPVAYARKLAAFCKKHDIVMIYDEMQSGFGRTGKMFGYEHYGVVPDLITCGKGISSSLPLSAVIGRKDIMGLYGAGGTGSTHSANPVCVAAALENLRILKKERLIERTHKMENILMSGLLRIQKKYPDVLGCVHGKGLVAGIQIVKPGTKIPDGDLALRINEACFRKGLLMFAPAGVAGECVKIAPPLVISEGALREGIDVLGEVCDELLAQSSS